MSAATESIWSNPPLTRDGVNLVSDLSCDVCVIGAGIAGLTTAYLLAKEGRSVVVLESQPQFAGGETQFTTAHLASAIDDRFMRLEKVRGPESSRLAYESHAAAINLIESIVTDERIECDFQRLDGYLFPGTSDEPAHIGEEFDAAHRAGAIVELCEWAPFPQFRTGPCLRFARQGQFHPLKYLVGVAGAMRRNSGRIYTRSRVINVESGDRCRVETKEGRTVSAGAVVIATNTPLASGPILNTKIAAYTTYALAGEVPTGSVLKNLYWDTDDPYHYVRIHSSGDKFDLLIVGGEDHKTGQVHDQTERWGRLEDWARVRFPDFGSVRDRWSGQVFETLDGLALIGPDPSSPVNVYISTGDSGMGMTHGTIAGLLLTDLIQGRTNPWAELYSPSRLPMAAAGTYFKENLNMAHQFKDWFTGGDVSSAEDVASGHGAVVRKGLKKVAIYRDEDGGEHELSATCTHLGCIVHWNDAEGTWDCPCHGSRFSPEGRVLHGPATSDLTAPAASAETVSGSR